MVLRLLLSASLALNPLAAMAQTQTPAKGVRGTFLEATNAPDWIVEGLAARAVKNHSRARELFIAAKTQLIAEQLPADTSREIIKRLDDLILSVGGSTNANAPYVNSVGGQNRNANNGKNSMNANSGNALEPENDAGTNDSIFDENASIFSTNNGTSTNGRADSSALPTPNVPVVDPNGNYSIADGDPKVLAAVLSDNPEARELLWWISAGRMSANAQQDRLKEIIRRDLGEDEFSNMDSFSSGYGMGYGSVEPGVVYDIMSYFGMFDKDYRKEMMKMKQKFDGSSPDEMAMKIVEDAAKYGAAVGGAFGLWNGLKKVGPRVGDDGFSNNDFGGSVGGQARAPMVADEILMFLNNTNAIVDIATLYEVDVDLLERQMIGMVAVGLASFAMKNSLWGKGPKPPKAGETGALKALFSKHSSVMSALAKSFRKAKAKGQGREFLEEKLESLTNNMAAVDLGGTPGVASRASGVNKLSGDPLDPNSMDPTDPADPADPNKPKKPRAPRRPTTPKEWALKLAYGVVGAGLNAAHGYAISYGSVYFAKSFFGGMYAENQKMMNRNFLRIMNSSKGVAFLKILAHSMHLGKPQIENFTADRTKDPHVAFIMNLSRTFGNCSRTDYVALDASKQTGGNIASQVNAARKALETDARANNSATAVQFDEHDLKVLRFSCPLQKNPYNYNLLMREMKSFSAISDRSVAYLRTSILRDRIKMAQLLLQFQYVDGEQNKHEERFYREVTSRLLGFDSKEQNHYIQVFAGFMKSSGGVVPDRNSPSGFSIAKVAEKKKSPFDYHLSPGPKDAPFEILAVDWDESADSNGTFK